MSTILEFYIEKEKRELINTINSAKYISEDQKESIISVLEVSDKWLKDKEDKARDAGRTHHADKLLKHRHDQKRGTRQVNRRDAEEYIRNMVNWVEVLREIFVLKTEK